MIAAHVGLVLVLTIGSRPALDVHGELGRSGTSRVPPYELHTVRALEQFQEARSEHMLQSGDTMIRGTAAST